MTTGTARIAELEEALRWYACPDRWASLSVLGDHDTVLLADESGWIKATVALLGDKHLQPLPPCPEEHE